MRCIEVRITLLSIFICFATSETSTALHNNRKTKRIAFGSPLPSLGIYDLFHFIQFRRTFACLTDQTDHENSITTCEDEYHSCGGALIHPEFVLTAAHCIMYYDVALYIKGEEGNEWEESWEYDMFAELWSSVKEFVYGIFVKPKPKHTVYTDWALLGGSHDWSKMKQKRHVVNVFPHTQFPQDFRVEGVLADFDRTLNSWHDLAVVQACQPFRIQSGEVGLAPMLRTVAGLEEQYERIVKVGMTCLYVGFGAQDNDKKEVEMGNLHPFYPPTLMLHTWRSSVCNAICQRYLRRKIKDETGKVIKSEDPHKCILCSVRHGPKLGNPESGDSGSPVTCEGKFVAIYTKGYLKTYKNDSEADSYPLHCIMDSITDKRLEYYKTLRRGSYHSLSNQRLRRFPHPSE